MRIKVDKKVAVFKAQLQLILNGWMARTSSPCKKKQANLEKYNNFYLYLEHRLEVLFACPDWVVWK